MMRRIVRLIGLLAAALAVASARADALQDAFDTVWESLWYQGGSAEPITRWDSEIRLRIHGRNAAWHRDRIVDALHRVGLAAGVLVRDVSDGADAASATLDIELVDDNTLMDNMACFVRKLEVPNSVIQKAQMRMREGAVYRCVLHEAMHVMGIAGHPRSGTILSYFSQRVDHLTDLDTLMLKAWYSPAMKPGMTPLEALPVLTNAVVAAEAAGNTDKAREAQRRYHSQVVQQMEAFATGEGELPIVLKRSGTASTEVMVRGRLLMRAYLSLAYLRGTLVTADPRHAARWMELAARDRLPFAQWMMGNFSERGVGQQASAIDAYVWYGLAAAQGVQPATAAQKRVASLLTPEDVETARRRMSSLQ